VALRDGVVLLFAYANYAYYANKAVRLYVACTYLSGNGQTGPAAH